MGFLPYSIRKIWNAEVFQGARKKRRYFEGWYNKIVSPDGDVYAFIPGISYDDRGDGEAFIQVIDGKSSNTGYFAYGHDAFEYSRSQYELKVGGSSFGISGLDLHLADGNGLHTMDTRKISDRELRNSDMRKRDFPSSFSVSGKIDFINPAKIQSRLLSPGIMGWYTFAPFMECYHGVVSLNHELKGNLTINGKMIDFTGGRGYIEKDWGRSFPSSWLWLQTNHFALPNRSFMLSLARIPWLGGFFPGFLCVLMVNDAQYRFATYTGAKITEASISDGSANVVIEDSLHTLEVNAKAGAPGGLKAPVNGSMARIITESVTSSISIRLTSKDGTVVFEDIGEYGGMEVAGDTPEIST